MIHQAKYTEDVSEARGEVTYLLAAARLFFLGDVLVALGAPFKAALSVGLPELPSTIQALRFAPTNWATVLFLLTTSAASAARCTSLCCSARCSARCSADSFFLGMVLRVGVEKCRD